MPRPVEVLQDEKNPIPAKIMAESIRQISEGTREILSKGINRRGLLVLLKDASGVSFGDINSVLESLSTLDKLYLEKKTK